MNKKIFEKFFQSGLEKIQWDSSQKEIKNWIPDFAKQIRTGDWFFVDGDLGSGKTTFLSLLFQELSPQSKTTSPTFTIMNVVDTPENQKIKKIIHMDLYRIKKTEEIHYISLEQVYEKNNSCVFIEWPWMLSEEDYSQFFSVTQCEHPERMFLLEISVIREEMRRYSFSAISTS